MSTLINNFDRLQNAINAGGAPWFQVVLPADIDTIPDRQLDQIPTAITLVSGANAYNIMATTGSPQWTETPRQVNGRLVYTSVFSFVIPKDRADVLNYAQHLNNRGVVAIVRDANGQNRLMGTKAEPATFRMSTRTLGNTSGNRNEHRYEIVLTSAKPVPFYSVTTHLPSPAGTCPPHPSITVAVDNANPANGDTITVTATANNITATTYDFYLPQIGGQYKRISQASNVYSWAVDFVGTGTIYVGCHDGSADSGYTITGVSVTATGYLLDGLTQKPNKATGNRILSTAYASAPIWNVRRSSGSPSTADFTYDEIRDGTLEAWVGGGNDGFITRRYDQTGCGNDDFQGTAAYQPQCVASGTLIVDSNGQPLPKTVDAANGIEFYGFGTATNGTAYLTCLVQGGNLSSRYGLLISRNANPGIGRFDDAGTDTFSRTANAGTPTYKVNGVVNTPDQRGVLGTALVGNECIVTISNIDWTQNIATWASTKIEFLEYCDIGTGVGDFILFNGDGTAQQSYIENEINSFYAYY